MRVRSLLPWLASVLSATTLIASNADLRLVDAVKNNDKESVQTLLKQTIDVNQTEPDGATALAWAVHHDNLEIAESLVRAGADVNAANDYGVAPLSLACSNGSAAM